MVDIDPTDKSEATPPHSGSLTVVTVASVSTVIGLGATLGFAFGGFYLMGDSWMSYNEVAGSYYTMTPVR